MLNSEFYENPAIGIILCTDKDNIEVEYALQSLNHPMGVSEYKLTKELPDELKSSLPTIEQIQNQLQKNQKISSCRGHRACRERFVVKRETERI